MTGIEWIARERKRQTDKLDWSPEHDDRHDSGELALVAALYASPERLYAKHEYAAGLRFEDPFPNDWGDARPHNGNVLKDATDEEAIRLLKKAGALIAAEIDRLLRKKATRGHQGPRRRISPSP